MDKITIGLVLLALGIWGAASWWWFLWDVIKGIVVIGLFLSGLTLVGVGIKNYSEGEESKSEAEV